MYAERITLKNGLETMRKRKRNAIIGWHNFNIENESEKHYWSRLMLFVPWRDEDQLKANYITYEDKYHDLIDQIKPIEDRFIHQEHDINDAFQHLQEVGPPQAAWDDIAPGIQEAEEIAQEEGIVDEHPMDQEDIQANIDHIVKEPRSSRNESLTSKYTKESNKHMLSSNEYNKYMQLLNNKQKGNGYVS